MKVGDPLPYAEATFDAVTAFDFFEHLPRTFQDEAMGVRNLFIDCMNEISRVLKPGGILIAATPGVPTDAAFADPTHVNYIAMETVDYFSGPTHAQALGYGYGGDFRKLECAWLPWSSPLYLCNDNGQPPEDAFYPVSPARSIRRSVYGFARKLRVVRGLHPAHILWVLERG